MALLQAPIKPLTKPMMGKTMGGGMPLMTQQKQTMARASPIKPAAGISGVRPNPGLQQQQQRPTPNYGAGIGGIKPTAGMTQRPIPNYGAGVGGVKPGGGGPGMLANQQLMQQQAQQRGLNGPTGGPMLPPQNGMMGIDPVQAQQRQVLAQALAQRAGGMGGGLMGGGGGMTGFSQEQAMQQAALQAQRQAQQRAAIEAQQRGLMGGGGMQYRDNPMLQTQQLQRQLLG
jgi:hypothetical protein